MEIESWSLFLQTLTQLYEILDELYLTENIGEIRKQVLMEKATNRHEKLKLIAKIVKINHGRNWRVPIMLDGVEGNV